MTNAISNSDDVIDSRDIIQRIEELRDQHEELLDAAENPGSAESLLNGPALHVSVLEDIEELVALERLAAEAEGYGDWDHGEQLIRGSYFTDYIEELIKDCYPLPKELDGGGWPWRHITIDYEAAADEAKIDYMEVDFAGETYFMRA